MAAVAPAVIGVASRKGNYSKLSTLSAASNASSEARALGTSGQNPAYDTLERSGLLCWEYSIDSADEINGHPPNSTMCRNVATRCGLFFALVVPLAVDCATTSHLVVKEAHIRTGQDQGGCYHFFLPGVHRLVDPFMRLDREDIPITKESIVHGNRSIVTISQGFVGLCSDRGNPVLLPPGMHQWRSDTLVFQRSIDLAQPIVNLGPYTLVTVDEGYAAITQDNGKQVICSGGQMHMLTHRNWKFEKFLTQKIQTNDLKAMQATTGDNVVLEVTANISWVISDVGLAARMATDTMSKSVRADDDLKQIKEDVLKQCSASLSAFVGGLTYAEKVGVSTAAAVGQAGVFDASRMTCARSHANEVCQRYGVEVIGINILSAHPRDQRLADALAAGAVAQANAEQAEATAKGQAKALLITAQGQGDAARLRADADLDAARKLEQSPIAVELARMKMAGEAIADKHALFFGAACPSALPSLLSNPAVVQGAAQTPPANLLE